MSDITSMAYIFHNSKFNGDISRWNVSNVKNMYALFWNSQFNGDISQWDVSNVEYFLAIFYSSKFNGDSRLWGWSEDITKAAFGPSFEQYKVRRQMIEEREVLKEMLNTHGLPVKSNHLTL